MNYKYNKDCTPDIAVYKDRRGIEVSGDKKFVDSFKIISEKLEKEEQRWISWLREGGIKASHPNDGWVDRENYSVTFCYPHFDDGVEVGDYIALGSGFDDMLIAKVTKIEKLFFGLRNSKKYYFEFRTFNKKKGTK